ncbi:acyltransferase family protein [Ideonella sp. BN130291]|uniref:acyltransferase family protein n=1 Tax=Ideonella sp. BN130291 TaxID=3112940 RepID=UPI002E27325B|nr:heparan-alpha-glucosaminide N-acetyltransferase domain-containing protein [Ideonella sp. BN130291]
MPPSIPPFATGTASPPPARLQSVDALRGLTVAAMLLVNNAGDWGHVHPWLEHARWHGLTPPDLVFPLFLVIMGVSISLGLVPLRERGADAAALSRKVLVRALRILLLGLLLQAVAWLTIEQRPFRVLGVLQRIGVCYAVAGLAALYLRAGLQWVLLALLLAGYGLLLAAGGSLQPWVNLPDRVDTWILGPHAYQFDAASGRAHDPEGLLSTVPAIASTLLGVRAGALLRRGAGGALLGMGLAACVAGALWAGWQPLNKHLWTPSFALWTGGLSLLLLALAHRLIDRMGAPPLGRAMGRNAITAYALAWLGTCALAGTGAMEHLYPALFAAPMSGLPPWVPSAAFAVAFTGVVWVLMAAMDRRRWYIAI